MSDSIRIADLREQFAAFSDANALIDAVEAAHDVAYVFGCQCADAWTGRGLHDPACVHVDGQDLAHALARFDFGDDAVREAG